MENINLNTQVKKATMLALKNFLLVYKVSFSILAFQTRNITKRYSLNFAAKQIISFTVAVVVSRQNRKESLFFSKPCLLLNFKYLKTQ